MHRFQERRVKERLSRMTIPELLALLDRPSSGQDVAATMDRLWEEKAALGALLKLGYFDPI